MSNLAHAESLPEQEPVQPKHKVGLLKLKHIARDLHLERVKPATQKLVVPIVIEARNQLGLYIDMENDQPKEGFESSQEFAKHDQEVNQVWAREKQIYNRSPLEFYPDDPELPSKKQSRILVECADGRNAPTLFMKREQLTGRYAIEWLPYVGLIIVPEIESGLDQDQLAHKLLSDLELKKKAYERLDMIFGQKIKEFLKRKTTQPVLAKLDFEFQAHFHGKEFPHHGCGAHCSDFNQAQAETIKNVFLLDSWLKEKYPKEYKAGDFRIYRTGHDTVEGGNVYSGSFLDQTRVTQEYRSKHQKMFDQAAKFNPPKVDQSGVTQNYQKNHLNIDVEEHDEQIVRVSQTHFAHTLKGRSALEISWTDSPELILDHLKLLLGIVDKNYLKHHPDKPAMLHLDVPARNYKIAAVFDKLRELIASDKEINDRIKENTLAILVTQTDPKTLKTRDSNINIINR